MKFNIYEDEVKKIENYISLNNLQSSLKSKEKNNFIYKIAKETKNSDVVDYIFKIAQQTNNKKDQKKIYSNIAQNKNPIFFVIIELISPRCHDNEIVNLILNNNKVDKRILKIYIEKYKNSNDEEKLSNVELANKKLKEINRKFTM